MLCIGCVIFFFVVARQGIGRVDEHAGILFHHREVRHGSRQGKAAAAVAEDRHDLGNNTGCLRVIRVDLRECVERVNTFLKAQAGAVDEADHRCPDTDRKVIDRRDLERMHFADAAAEYGGILAVHAYRLVVDHAVPGNNTVAKRPNRLRVELGRPCAGIGSDLHEAAFVEQSMDSLSRCRYTAHILHLTFRNAVAHPSFEDQLSPFLRALLCGAKDVYKMILSELWRPAAFLYRPLTTSSIFACLYSNQLVQFIQQLVGAGADAHAHY